MPTMRIVKFALVAGVCVLGASVLCASGPLGVFAIIEKVVFEPNEANAERLQVWGAFAYAEGSLQAANGTSAARKGYMYFRLDSASTEAQRQTVRNEWNDLKAVAGTGQAVGFGNWFYVGQFGGLDPAVKSTQLPTIMENTGGSTDMRVRPATEALAAPAVYRTNIGVVKLAGTHAVVQKLKDALK